MQVDIVIKRNESFLVKDSEGRHAWYPKSMVAQEGNQGTVPDHEPSHKHSFESHHQDYVSRYETKRSAADEQKALRIQQQKEAKNEFRSRIVAHDGELPLIASADIPSGAKSMLASIRDGVEGAVIAVARVIVPENTETGAAQAEYLVYKQVNTAALEIKPETPLPARRRPLRPI